MSNPPSVILELTHHVIEHGKGELLINHLVFTMINIFLARVINSAVR